MAAARPRALVVDDVPTTAAVLRRMLERDGCEVDVTRTVAGALQLLKPGGHYAVAIVDMLLPDSPDGETEEARARATLDMLRPGLAGVSDVRIYTGVTGATLASYASSLGFSFYEKGGSALPAARDPTLAELEELSARLDGVARAIDQLNPLSPERAAAVADAIFDRVLGRLGIADVAEVKDALEYTKQLRAHTAFAAKLIATTLIVSIAGAVVTLLANGLRLWGRAP